MTALIGGAPDADVSDDDSHFAVRISQDRIVGAHFFSPAHIMPLLEIVRTDRTSPQVLVLLNTPSIML